MRTKPADFKKPKFSKHKCLTCCYHAENTTASYPTYRKSGHRVRVYCNYASITGHTCLQPAENNTVVDSRGEDYNDCKLYRQGAKIETEIDEIIIGRKRYENQIV